MNHETPSPARSRFCWWPGFAATAAAITIPKVNFTDTRLKNGLRVIISPDRAAPVVSVAVAYNVGSRNERKGRTGFAHLFEHLMFKGSENVADGELAGLIENNGGNHNGQTDKDHTIYFEQVPSNQLDMVLFLEADRMRSPAITQENVDNQREAVKEERRLRMDNQPYGRTSEMIAELRFENFANEHSIIGSMADLDAASLEDFTAFFKTYYAPNNAVLAIAGDVDAKMAIEKVRKYFESIPPGPPPPPLDTTEPAQKEERRSAMQDPLARLTLVDIGVSGAGRAARHGRAVRAGLGAGRGPQLGTLESLVRQQQVAVQVYAGVAAVERTWSLLSRSDGGAREGSCGGRERHLCRSGEGPERADSGMGARQGAQRGAAQPGRQPAQLVAARDSALALTVFYDDRAIINTRYERIASLKIEDLQRVARQYLVPTNRAVIVTPPAPKPGRHGREARGCDSEDAALLSALCSLLFQWRCWPSRRPPASGRARRRPNS